MLTFAHEFCLFIWIFEWETSCLLAVRSSCDTKWKVHHQCYKVLTVSASWLATYIDLLMCTSPNRYSDLSEIAMTSKLQGFRTSIRLVLYFKWIIWSHGGKRDNPILGYSVIFESSMAKTRLSLGFFNCCPVTGPSLIDWLCNLKKRIK